MHEKLSDDLAAALLRASRVLVGVAARSLADADDVVTLAQFRALVVLDGHRGGHPGEGPAGLNQVGLAERLGVNASTALRMVDRLVRADLVAREPHPDSRREVLLRLTTEGRRLVDRVTARRREELARIAARMPAESRDACVAALEAFSIAAGEPVVADRDEALWLR